MYTPHKGDIIKIHHWHGVVLNVFTDAEGGTVLQVQTVRNVFRGYGAEFIELAVAPDSIQPAGQDDLDKEIAYFTQMREMGLTRMLAAVADNGQQAAVNNQSLTIDH